MRNNKLVLLCLMVLSIFTGCDNKKKNKENEDSIIMRDPKELEKYINMEIPIKGCIFEFSKRGIKKERTNIGLSDYQLYAVLYYTKDNFNKIVEKIHHYNKIDNVFIEINKVPKWIPNNIINRFQKENEYYHLVNSYEPKLFLSSNNSLFRKGFCYIIDDENIILLYFYTS